jgi:preprotein translocase subunit SecE
MSSQDLNREQKRALKRMGALNDQGAPVRTARGPQSKSSNEPKVGFFGYLREVREEMRKVAWPTWPEVRKYSLVVLVTVVIFTALVGGLDFVFGVFSNWLYKD